MFLQKNSAAPFLNSQLKWWQREPRFSVNLGAQIRVKHTVFNCSVLDVATGGCFVEFNEKLVSGETTWIRIHMGEFDFTALARVVWVNPAGVKGVGLRFVGMGRNDRKVLKKLIRFLDNASAHGLKVNQGIPKAS